MEGVVDDEVQWQMGEAPEVRSPGRLVEESDVVDVFVLPGGEGRAADAGVDFEDGFAGEGLAAEALGGISEVLFIVLLVHLSEGGRTLRFGDVMLCSNERGVCWY